MRIVHVINSLATGGAETLVVELAASMRAEGHDVAIVTIGRAAGVPLAAAERHGIPVVAAGRSPYDPGSVLRLRRLLRTADVAHVHLFPALYFAAAAGGRTPLVYTEHSTWNRRRDSAAFHPFDRFAYRRYYALTAISPGVRDALASYLDRLGAPADITVVPNGIADAFFDRARTREPASPTRVIAVGTLDARKNFADAVRAVAARPGTTLTIVGGGGQHDELAELIHELGVGDRVTLAGPSNDVGSLMDQHDLLLSTSRFEGFSLVAAEAMAMGLPVVGPRVDGFRDSVTDGEAGILFDQGEGIDGIRRAIDAAVSDPTEYARLSRGAARNAERFRVADTARAYLEVYGSVLDASAIQRPRRDR